VWFPLASIPLSLVASVSAGARALPGSVSEVAGHLLVFGTALVGQITLTQGLARTGAARATAVTMTGPVFGLLFGWLMFGTVPGATSVAGTVLVILAVIRLAAERPVP
jgi:drug/metabolite transporter (DMT)-like permease